MIAEHLRDLGWEVYAEVQMHYGGPRADMVATQGPVLWVIETKSRLSFKVIEQAAWWTGFAHRVSVGVPAAKRGTASRKVAHRTFRHLRLGLIEVTRTEWPEDPGRSGYRPSLPVRETIDGKLARNVSADLLRRSLCEEQKTWAAPGNADSEYWTPFKSTVRELNRFVRAHPGCTLKELVEGIDYHWRTPASAKGCIPRYIREGIIEGIEVRKESRRLYFYPENEAA